MASSSSAANTPSSSHSHGLALVPNHSHPSLASPKPPRILACVLCQHRKIRCDRNFPCANCTKANVKCTPSTPAPARKRRRPNQDLQERLARCEELLKEYATDKPDGPATPRPATQAPVYDDSYLKWQPAGKLIREDGSMRFMDNPLLGTVYDELRAMRDIIDSEDTDDCTTDHSTTPDENSDLLFGADTPAVNPETLWPDASHVVRLWQIYLDRVNPLTKIIHVPTMQPFVLDAVGGPQRLPKNIEALLFSIFLMAVVALEPDECQGVLGCPREVALERYSAGVRLTLLRIGFLKTHDLTVLQALVIYLISLQGRYNRHAAWILNGVVIRIAQKMGLHRDGERLGLAPFEAEMRRRLWWQIIMVDSKYAIFSGLSHSLLPRGWDTKTPKNVNDADIFPTATEPFQDREGPTEMVFCLLTYTFAKFLVETPGFDTMFMLTTESDLATGHDSVPEEQLADYRRTVENLGKQLLDILDKWCDPMAGRIHEMAINMRKHIIDKIMELITPAKLQPEWGGEVRSRKDNTFKVAIGTLEHNEANYMSTKDKGFIWFSLSHFQMDIFLYMAGQLCHRTEGRLVERAWRQVEVVYTFHPELFDTNNKAAAVLAIFILKAWKKREETIYGQTGMLPEMPFYVEKLRASMPDENYKSEPTPPDPYTPVSLAIGVNQGAQDVDSFLGYLDPSAIDWDMFGAPAVNGGPGVSSFGPFGVGPSVDW